MGCEPDVFEKDTSVNSATVSYDKGVFASLEFDSKSGDLISFSDNASEKSEVTNGTVYKIVTHDNGNRTIYDWTSTYVCYTKEVGLGPCEPCCNDDDV